MSHACDDAQRDGVREILHGCARGAASGRNFTKSYLLYAYWPHPPRTGAAMSLYPISLFAMLSVAACAPMGSEPPPPDADATGGDPPVQGPEPPGIVRLPEGECDAAAAQRYVGQKADSTVVQAAMTASKARQVRVIEPDMMVTMDFRSDRLNIRLDDTGKIVAITCG
jgi:Peptidase inhibitor I78 family